MPELNPTAMSNSFYDFTLNDIDGQPVPFSRFKGKPVLLVNVASECGFTPQYADLQALHQQHGNDIFVLGFPSNNFGGQEPGTHTDIKAFCQKNFGVTFTLFEKIDVIGKKRHDLYRWLSKKEENGLIDQEPNWNFCKYLVSGQGQLLGFFPSATNPFNEGILKHIN